MAGIPTLTDDLSLDVLRTHLRFATARVKADPNASQYVAGLATFLTQWNTAAQQELTNEDAVTDALAAAVTADSALDALVDAVNLAINGAKRPSADNPVQKLFFGSKPPSKFKQPILGDELKEVEPWPALLTQSTMPALKALAAQATTAVQNGTAAAQAVQAAIAAREGWISGGPRKALFDAFNALAATTYGGLKAFALSNASLNLPKNYAESFFLHTAPSPYGKTVNQASAKLATAQKKAAIAQKHHDALAATAATRAAELVAKQKAEAALEAAKATTRTAKKAEKEAAAAAGKKVRR